MRILFLGDVVGSIGLEAVVSFLPEFRKKEVIDFVIVNGENAAKGKGILYSDYSALMDAGADVVTLGNHWRSKSQIDSFIDEAPFLLRPANLKGSFKGSGTGLFDCNGAKIRVTNLLGKVFMEEDVYSPIACMDEILDGHEDERSIHIVDFHGEASSEKQMFAYYFDGSLTSVIGTHTHVQTNDQRILPEGTSLITDAGFCGAYDSIIGAEPSSSLEVFVLEEDNAKLRYPSEGKKQINGVILDVDPISLSTKSIRTIFLIDGKERKA